MTHSLKTLLLSASFICASGAAFAQAHTDFPHWYIGLSGQLAYVGDADVDVNGAGAGEVEFDDGYAVGAALGWRPYPSNSFFDRTRFELEYTYRDQGLDSVSNLGTTTKLNGDLTGHTYMVNAYYDINTGSNVTPYIGGGIGAASWDMQDSVINVDDSSTVFAYQGMAGLMYSPETIPNTDWGLGYRYFATQDPKFTTNTGAGVEHEYDSHNIEARANFRF